MDIKGIITGDIVRSESIDWDKRDLLLKVLGQIVDELQVHCKLRMENYRGDGFQIVVEQPEKSLRVASMVRAGLICHTPEGEKNRWDARVSIGIGKIEYHKESIAVSDGEAYRLSGRGLDNMDKTRIAVSTPWADVNEELDASIGFVDGQISRLNENQANLVFLSVAKLLPQAKIAELTGKSQQNISKSLYTAWEPLLNKYLNHFEKLIIRHIDL